MAKILLVEDDLMLLKLVCQHLRSRLHVVDAVGDADEAAAYLDVGDFDLVIMDWCLPGQSGLTGVDLCSNYRQKGGEAPVLFLTGQSDIDDKTAGFNAGADDYLCKPFDIKELLLRVESLLRRPAAMKNDVLRAGSLTVEPRAGRVIFNGEEIMLQPREMALLEFLMRHPDTIYEPADLLARVWETDSDAGEVALRTCVSNIRKKLGISDRKSIIESVHGRGYRFNSPSV